MGWLKRITDWLSEQDWGIFNWLRDILITVFNWLQDLAEEWLGWLIDLGKWVGDHFWRFYRLVVDWWDKLWKILCDYWGRFTRLVGDLWNGLVEWVDAWWNKVTDFFLYDLPKIWDKIWGLIETVSNWASGVISEVSLFLSKVWPLFSQYVNGSIKLLFDLWDGAKKSIENLTNKIGEISTSFQNFLKVEWHPFTSKITDSLNSLTSFVKEKVWGAVQNLNELFWGWINDLEHAWQLFKERRKAKPKILPTVHVNLTKETHGKMGIGRKILEGLLEVVIEVIIWIIASFAVDVVIDWLYGDYDLEKGELTGVPIEMTGFLEWMADLSTGKLEIKTPIATGPLIPVIIFERGGK